MSRKYNKHNAYSWVAYMFTHQPEEMQRVLRYGTPSDELIRLSNKRIYVSTASSTKKKILTFPVSLSTSRGQKALYEIATRFYLHVKCIPIKMYNLLQHVKDNIRHRRSDTQKNVLLVAEALTHRAASEYKTEVIFAFDSINTWIKAVYGKELGYHTIRKAIELLQDQGVLEVSEWGVKGNRHKATKILLKSREKSVLAYSPEIDSWLTAGDAGMMAVYARESTTRQNVLEKAIHHFSDMIMADQKVTSWLDMTIDMNNVAGMFDLSDASIVEVEVTTVEETNDYFDRLLGELVPAVQEIDSTVRQVGSELRGPYQFGENRSGPPRECLSIRDLQDRVAAYSSP